MHPRFLPYLLALTLFAGGLSGCAKTDNRARFLEVAKKHFDAGEYEKAKAEYRNVLRLEPGNGDAIKHLGLIWMEQGAPLRAAPFLVEMSSRDPKDISLRTKLTDALMALQDFSRAHNEASAILKLDPSNEEALLHLAASAKTPEHIAAADQAISAFVPVDPAVAHVLQAALLLRAGDTTAAEQAIRRAVQANPKSLPAHVALAKICLLKKDEVEAGVAYEAVSKLAPLRSPERLSLAEFKLRQGTISEARALVDELTKQADDYLPAWVLSARLAAAAKNNAEAYTHLKKVTDIDSDNYDARMLQAQLLAQEGKVKPAIDLLENLLRSYPGHPAVQYHLAKAWVQDGQAGKAVPLLTQSVSTNPDLVEAALLLGGLNLQRGAAEEVITQMRTLREKHPGLVPAVVLQALALRAARRPAEGAVLMKDLVRKVPNNPHYRHQLGLMHREAGEFKEARQVFEELLKLNSDDLSAVRQLVELDIVEGRFPEALARVEPLLNKPTGAAEAYFLRGEIFSVQQKWDEAETALVKSIEVNGNNVPAYDLLVKVYVAANKLPQALERANQTVAKQPESWQALLVAALICEKVEQFTAARGHYEKLLALSPDLPTALNNLAFLYSEHLNEPQKALDTALRARKLRPPGDGGAALELRIETASIADTLGWIHYKRGDYREAVDLCREATRELGGNPEVQYHFAMAAAMMGEIETARASLASALKPGTGLPDDFPDRNGIQARLDLMGGSGTPAKVVSSAELESAAQKQPNDPMVQCLLGMAREREKDFPRAARAYEKAAELNPAMAAAAINLARLYAGPQNDPKKALELARKARQLAPDDTVTAGVLGGIAFKAGDYPWAYDLLSQGKRTAAPRAGVLRDLAWASYSLGKVAEARQSMQAILNDLPDSPEAAEAKLFLALTGPAGDAKSVAELSAAAENTLQSDASHVPSLMVRARRQALNGETVPAITTCNAILARFPDFAPAQVQLAAIYSADPKTREKAWELASKARNALPNDLDLIRTLAVLNFHKKDYRYAIQLLETSGRTSPLNPEGLYYLGAAQLSAGDKVAGRKSLAEALAAGLPESLATEARTILDDTQKP